MSQRVLVTGANGFSGHYLCQALGDAGYEVVRLVLDHPGPSDLVVDLNNEQMLDQIIKDHPVDYVIHLAALAFVAHQDQEAFYRVNVFGTLNLLASLAKYCPNLQKVILASSANVYGIPPVSQVSETVVPQPVNQYAMSKLAMEYMARTWLDRLPIVFTRPFNYTGVGQNESFLIPKIVSHFKQRKSVIELGNLDVEREFNDVRMVAQAYITLLTHAPIGTTVNLCTGIGHRLLEVVAACEGITGHSLDVEVNPAFVRQNELPVLIGDPTLLHTLGVSTSRFTLNDTLSWMLNA